MNQQQQQYQQQPIFAVISLTIFCCYPHRFASTCLEFSLSTESANTSVDASFRSAADEHDARWSAVPTPRHV